MTGTKLLSNRYQLLSKLGAGGMGSVWRARDHTLDADVAVKLMDPQLVGSPVALARFRREAHAAAAIRSSYVVQILDYGVDVDGNIPFIAMELLNGESLAARLKHTKIITPDVTARVMGHVGRALTLAHEQGIVHRDLKPDNIFLVHEGDEELGKVLDFGIARRNEGLGQSTGLETQAGSILGTPFYMSPEQAGGDAVDALSDIWAYGVVTCECLVGTRPFQADSLGGLFRAICLDPLPVPSRIANVPPGFDAWFARAVARDKAARFPSIAEATRALRSICAGAATSPVGATPANVAVPNVAAPYVAVGASSSPAEQRTVTFERTTPPSVASIADIHPAPSHRVRWLVLAAGALAATAYLGVLVTSRFTDSSAAKASADSAGQLLVSASKPPSVLP
ncbi:MAG TPA: serine/threonine-protein kinase, partial [Polyangiaceae bacterium]|nr:serine/threonine-protein kinase [Polyangiaceae bacterium]